MWYKLFGHLQTGNITKRFYANAFKNFEKSYNKTTTPHSMAN